MGQIKTELTELLRRLERIETLIDASKELYEERDSITLALRDLGLFGPGVVVEHEGKTFTLIDNFSEKNVAYRVAFVRRFEVKIKPIKPAKETK